MIFVDANVFMYAVGRPHPLREPARSRLREATRDRTPLATSAEVLQELLHAYLPVGRLDTLDAALRLARETTTTVWPVEGSDVSAARALHRKHPHLSARDLLHLSVCRHRRATGVLTYDQRLAEAYAA